MKAALRAELEEMYGKRVSFRPIERLMYSRDTGTLPGLFSLVYRPKKPAAVAQPTSAEKLRSLIEWAAKNKIPLTPRGMATSGYGGAVPFKSGIVVDFYYLKDILEINQAAETVRVQPGITWKVLDAALAKEGLTLKLYPTSYPSSTVGGWLAQGGAGLGSYSAGFFKENVLSAKVITASGEERTFSGDELELVADAEGTTGFISEVELAVAKKEPVTPLCISFETAEDASAYVEAIDGSGLDVWSVHMLTPEIIRMKNLAGDQIRNEGSAHGAHENHPRLKESYLVCAVAHNGNSQALLNFTAGKLKSLAQNSSTMARADILDRETSDYIWAERFKLLVIERLGPSVVPAEFIVPAKNLPQALSRIQSTMKHSFGCEVFFCRSRGGETQAVVLAFLPADERRFRYNFLFGLSLAVMKIARQLGGRVYTTGAYFTHHGKSVHGQAVKRMRAFKKQTDPKGILNPGKVYPNRLAKWFRLFEMFTPVIRFFANRVPLHENVPAGQGLHGKAMDEAVRWAYTCTSCGFCISECDQFYGRGWESQTPRGKWLWLKEFSKGNVKWDQAQVDTFIACTTCELCNINCCAAMPIEPTWLRLRGQAIQDEGRMTFPPFEIMSAALESQGDIWAGYRKNRADWFPEDLWDKHGPEKQNKMVYFAGCTASYVETDIAIASVRLLDEAGADFGYVGEKENCCGTPMLVAGKWDIFAETMKKNIAAVKEQGADTVVTSCPACDMMWRKTYPQWAEKLGVDFDIKTRHYSEVVDDAIEAGTFSFKGTNGNGTSGGVTDAAAEKPVKVTWHDSCHIGRASGVYEPPRNLIKSMPGVDFVEMEHNREGAHCCGSVLTLIKEPDVAADVGEMRIQEAVDAGAEKILALCPCCEFQLRVSADAKDSPVEIVDLAHFAVEKLGYELPDPHPDVRANWAVFEKMIPLMTPEGFAGLMQTMWPELIAAMPFGMGPVMRFFGKLKMVGAFKPFFPLLFPVFLPMMMPKVLPTMLERIKGDIPMPDYMAEQMPDLMPKVMDNLMPHMLPDLIPLISTPLVDYLHGRKVAA